MACLDNFREELTGPTDKWFTLAIFVGPRGLAKKTESSFWAAHAEDRLGACASQFIAPRA
jgi:hypothetical protein